MNSRLIFVCLISIVLLASGCDKSPTLVAVQKSSEAKGHQSKLMALAEKGDVQAQVDLGDLFRKGQEVAKDLRKAMEWYQKAAALGNAQAQANLGEIYEEGEGVAKDVATAIEWYQKAAAQGNAFGLLKLGECYRYGSGVKEDTAKAFELYEKAAMLGNSQAQFEIGGSYLIGEKHYKSLVKRQDYAKAFEWLQKSAEQGNPGGQIMLAAMYSDGNAVPKDERKAFEWVLKAAVQGNPVAQEKLGYKYANGRGVEKDLVLAYGWYNLAAASKFAEDMKNWGPKVWRDELEKRLTDLQISEGQRLSSAWKNGQILVREARGVGGSAESAISGGALRKKGSGTLFLINAAGQAITNDHVVKGCRELRIDGREGLAKIVTEDVVNDLALMQVPGEIKASATITADASKVRQGEEIVVFGFPLNSVLSSGGNLTLGVLSGLTGLGNNSNQIQITAPIQPGSSGSPVLNKKGEVVGVVSMKISDENMVKATGQVAQNINFAINVQTLRTFFDTHKVNYRSGAGFFARDKNAADLADEARKWTLVVECWN